MLKLKMMLCVMMLPLVVVGCTSKQSGQSVRTPRLRRGYAAPRPVDTTTDYFTPQREADHYAKTTGRNQKYINEQ